MNAIANTHSITENAGGGQQAGKAISQTRISSRKIESILMNGPLTTNYVNKDGLLIADDDMMMIFGKIADRRNNCLLRKESELRPLNKASSLIEEGLNEDIRKGWQGLIRHIKASPETVKRLYIEGILTQEILEKSLTNDGTVIFCDVPFNTEKGILELPIICSDEYRFDFATIERSGNMIR